MNRVIEVKVSPTGNVTVQTKGYAGSDCLQASKFLQDTLGMSVNEIMLTEFYLGVIGDQHVEQK